MVCVAVGTLSTGRRATPELRVSSTAGAVSPACGGLPPEVPLRATIVPVRRRRESEGRDRDLATREAARLHDRLIGEAFNELTAGRLSSTAQRRAALQQARLPVKLGGAGLTSMSAVTDAAIVVDAIRRAGVVLLPVHLDVARRQARLVAAHAALDAKYQEDKKTYYFYDKTGRAYRIYNPRGLPPAHAYLPLTEWSSRSNLLQKRSAPILRDDSPFSLEGDACGGGPRREEGAGARRFGLHLSMMTDVMADSIYSQHGLPFDALGDVAQNDGAAGHQTRHKEVLLDLVELLRGKLGRGAVEHEFHCEHSTTRTDLYIYQGVIGDLPGIGDTKIFASVPSDPSGAGRMGAFVACGNTLPRAREPGLGVEGGDRGGRVGRWDPRTGSGTVEAVKGQYTDAEGKCRVEALLFEEFGAMSAGVEELLRRVAEVAGRKLTWWQYDQTSWSAREWMPFALQRLSVQLWVALADEAQRAIGAASRGREGPRGNASGMGGSEGKGAGGAQ
ncbi:hypothetical protein EMIHUDRAFT_227018 [Emiliania huxleyi CCMP1516]|uniref:Uncharacterized protein n=2 Tax=Emiliania huxleyi TaxID=2903 RepID=A0A0D3KJI6_EMIH1|nr:hypothetical protein EMIHUDRAFT_227018 [Emiliania huxleyi CCMP1516]EOD35921.1 hypothetical protein EMIHUDRAFT_227018 [Emiliania huxleyi CCMP1516]|eukprot:XP_005788350.1 hypothetical protein EMIHUDRAFT_227018 [Emiliania huxleyi CCMP1516]